MADPQIKIKVGLDFDQAGAERLKQMPKEVQAAWESLGKMGDTLGGARGGLLQQAAERIGAIGQQGIQQGFLTRVQRQELERSTRQARDLIKGYYQAQIEEARKGGANLEREIAAIGDRLAKAQGSEHQTLQSLLKAKQAEFFAWKDRGRKPDLSGIEAERAAMLGSIDEAQFTAQLVPTVNDPAQQQRRRGFGFLGSFGRGLLGGATLGGGYLLASKVRQEFREELSRGMAVADLSQRIRPEGMSYGDFRQTAGEMHRSFTPEESTQFLSTYSSLVGGPRGLTQSRQAAGLTRAFGFSPQEGAGIFGQAGRMGLDQGKFAEQVGQGVIRAQLQGREGEVFQSLLQMSERLLEFLGRVPDMGEMAGLLSRLSSSGLPGLQGQYGAAAAMRFDEGIRGTSLFPMGDLRRMAMLTTFSNMGITDPAEMLRIQEEGMLGEHGLGRGMLQTIDQYGGATSFMGENLVKQIGLSLNTYPQFREAFISSSRSGSLDNLRGLVGKDRLDGIPPERMMDVLRLADRAQQQGMTAEQAKAELDKVTQENRPEVQAREELANIKRLEAEAVRKLIPAYTEMLVGVGKAGAAFVDFSAKIEELLGKAGVPPEIAKPMGPISSILTGMGALSLLKRGGQWLLSRGAAAAGEAAGAAGEAGAGGITWGMGGTAALLAMLPFTMSGDYDPAERKRRLERRGAMLGALMGPATAQSRERERLRGIVSDAASAHGLPPETLLALVQNESGFRPSIAGPQTRHGRTYGLGQILQGPEGPFPQYSAEDLKDPTLNANLSARYFRQMLDRYRGNLHMAAQAYNAGPGNVDKYGGVVPFKETREYTARYFENLSKEMTGSATIYVDLKDKHTGEPLGHTEVPLQPTKSNAATVR